MWSCPWHGVEQLSYDRVDARLSDHRPVIAYFNVEIKLTDKIKKQQIVRQVYEVRLIKSCLYKYRLMMLL